jgi:hypothetical protein
MVAVLFSSEVESLIEAAVNESGRDQPIEVEVSIVSHFNFKWTLNIFSLV